MELNKIYNINCLKGMKMIPDKSMDMIFSDIPFGTTNCRWDTIIPLEPLWEQYERVIKDDGAILLFAQTPFDKVLGSSNIKLLRYEWIWEKTAATGHLNAKKMPLKAHENILVFYKKLPTYNPQKTFGHKPVNTYTKYLETQNRGEIYNQATKEVSGGGATDRFPRSVLKYASDKQRINLHPTQKPLGLIEELLLTYTNPNECCLDSCIGSATLAIAAIKNNRNYIGFELDKTNFDKGVGRIEHFKKTGIDDFKWNEQQIS